MFLYFSLEPNKLISFLLLFLFKKVLKNLLFVLFSRLYWSGFFVWFRRWYMKLYVLKLFALRSKIFNTY